MALMRRVWLSVILLLLSGCLDAEKFSLSLDLKDKTSEVVYANIVSDSKEERKIREDFEELIEKTSPAKEETGGKPGKLIAARLNETDGHLDCAARYVFRDSAEMLKEYEIKTDEKGDFIFDLSKEGNRDLEYAGGNGKYIEEGKKRFVRWDRNSTSLTMNLKNRAFSAKNKSLLSYWMKWKEGNPK